MDSKSIINNTITSDIYCDLNTVDLGEKIIQLQELLKLKELRIEKYEDDVRKLCFELTRMKKTECNLKTNISELYKASKLEIERKDRQIAELQGRIAEFVIKSRSGKIGNSFKCFRDEAYTEDPPELPQTKNDSIQQFEKTKSPSKSPKHRSPTVQQTELMVKDTSKIQYRNNNIRSRSPRHRSRSRHSLQSRIEYDSPIQNRRSKSRSKSDSTQKSRLSADGGSKVLSSSFKHRKSRSRPNSPKHRRRSIERSRSTLPGNTFKMQNKTSKSRSKSPTYNSCHTQKSRSVEQNSVIQHHDSRSRSASLSQKGAEMQQHQPIKSRSKSPRHVDYSKRTILKARDKSAVRLKGTKNCSKSRDDRRQQLQIRIKSDSTVRQVRSRKSRSPVYINRNSRCRYTDIFESTNSRSHEKYVPNMENDVPLGYSRRKIYKREAHVINNKSKGHESELKHGINSKRIEEKIKASDNTYLLVNAMPHEKQSASDLCDKENGKDNCNRNSDKVESSDKSLISNNKLCTAFVNETDSELINNSSLDNQKRPTTDILTSDSLPKNMLPNTPTAGDDVNSEIKKTDITVHRRRRCVIQLI